MKVPSSRDSLHYAVAKQFAREPRMPRMTPQRVGAFISPATRVTLDRLIIPRFGDAAPRIGSNGQEKIYFLKQFDRGPPPAPRSA